MKFRIGIPMLINFSTRKIALHKFPDHVSRVPMCFYLLSFYFVVNFLMASMGRFRCDRGKNSGLPSSGLVQVGVILRDVFTRCFFSGDSSGHWQGKY